MSAIAAQIAIDMIAVTDGYEGRRNELARRIDAAIANAVEIAAGEQRTKLELEFIEWLRRREEDHKELAMRETCIAEAFSGAADSYANDVPF